MKPILTFITITLTFLLFCSKARSQDGTLDPNFGINGIASITFQSGDFKMYDSEVLPDGKILCFGKFFISTSNGFFPTVVRLNADGSGIDFSFGNNGVKVLSEQLFLIDIYMAITLDNQGYVYAAGTGGSNIYVYKLTVDGQEDLNFGINGMVELTSASRLADIKVQADGKIVVASTLNNDFVVSRMNNNGTMDMSFGTNGVQSHSVFGIDNAYGLTLQSDGKILVCGYTDNGFGPMLGIIRMNANGSLDNSFGSGGKVSRIINGSDFAYSITVTPSGKVVVAGRTTNGLFNQKGLVAQFNADGSEDTNFGTSGVVEIQLAGNADFFSDVLIQTDGKILATGIHDINGTNSSFLIARLNSDGSPDVGFGLSNDGTAIATLTGIDMHGLSISLDSNGDAIIGGAFQNDNAIRVAKFYTGLALSTSEDQVKSFIKIFPNPANTALNINLENYFDAGIISLVIHNSIGEMVYEKIRIHGPYFSSIDVSQFNNGVYFVSITINGKIFNSRFVKH